MSSRTFGMWTLPSLSDLPLPGVGASAAAPHSSRVAQLIGADRQGQPPTSHSVSVENTFIDECAVPTYPGCRGLLTHESAEVFCVSGYGHIRVIGRWQHDLYPVPMFVPSLQWLDRVLVRALAGWTADEWQDRLRSRAIPGLYVVEGLEYASALRRPRVHTRTFIEALSHWITE